MSFIYQYLTYFGDLNDNQKLDLGPLPASSGDTAKTIWENGLTIAFGLAAGIALLMIVVNGYMYITASGDPKKTAEARQGILYSAIGLVVALSAITIVTFVIRGIG